MGRLIDADAFIEYANRKLDLFTDELRTMIEEQPTAYDVSKVVEELKKTMQDLSVIEVFSHIDFDSTIQSGLDNFLKSYNSELLRIVKQGGVSDDVCEWESVSDGEFIQNPHTKRLYSNEPSMKNVYCNTCGKKIKIVGD